MSKNEDLNGRQQDFVRVPADAGQYGIQYLADVND